LAPSSGDAAVENRSVAARRVCGQRELTDHERRAARIQKRAVHPASFIGENSQFRDFAGQFRNDLGRITRHSARQDQQAGADLADDRAVYRDTGFGHTLDQSAHQS
jgi:hypothetical protein